MAFCKRDQGQIFYEVQGKGEPLLLLRGLGRSSRYWLGYEKQLSRSFKVIQIDLRGLGRTQLAMQWSDSIDVLAEDCLSVLDQLRIDRAHIFGLSLGGMVALSLAADHSDRCRSVVVANSSSVDYLAFRLHPLAVKDLLLGRLRGQLNEALLARTIPGPVARMRGPEILASWASIQSEEGLPVETIGKQLVAAARFRIRGKFHGEHPPVLFLSSSMDGLVPPYNTRQLHKLVPGSRLEMIKGASHEIQVGYEAELAQILQQFCNPV